MRWARSLVVAGATGSVVLGSAVGVLAAPATAPIAEVVVTESLQPVLHGKATSSGYGEQRMTFSARTAGSTTWNLYDNVSLPGTDAFLKLEGGRLTIGDAFEYQIAHCDQMGCKPSAVKTSFASPALGAGPRPGATLLPFAVGDGVDVTLDAGSGNLMVNATAFALPRRAADTLDVGLTYNSVTRRGEAHFAGSVGAASTGWRLSTGGDVRLRNVPGHGSVVFYGERGLTGTFLPLPGSPGAYTAPPGFKMTLTGSAVAGWALLDHATGDTRHFDARGRLIDIEDRSGNKVTFAYSAAGALTAITSDVGPAAARTLEVTTTGSGAGRITGLTQRSADGSSSRGVTLTYDATGKLTGMTDVLGRTTEFFHGANGNLNRITAPGGGATEFTYDAYGRIQSVSQPTAGGGSALTRIRYPSWGTILADPNTDPAVDVFAGPDTRFHVTTDGMLLVAKSTDPTGVVSERTYTPALDVASETINGKTITYDYDPAVNGGESLTGTTAPTGAQNAYEYEDPSAPFDPSAGTDAQRNTEQYVYDEDGNPVVATAETSATATKEYNADGTVSASTSPSGARTTYGYAADTGLLTTITPAPGSSLGVRTYAYDGYGRASTYTSGRGITESYTYDAADRITKVSYSDGTPTVTYEFGAGGQVATRTDASGTTAFTYDPLGRLTSRTHSAGGGELRYTYDRAGNLVTETDAHGTTRHGYDDRNLLVRTQTPDGGVIVFANDAGGRRTDTWFHTNDARTTWAAHTHSDFDASGRTVRTWTARASNDAVRVSDLAYSYASPGTAACATAPAQGVDTELKWSQTDHVTGRTTSYCYDGANRLVAAVTAGGDSWAYAYDLNGNRIETLKNGVRTQSQTVNGADQLTGAGYSHDASGNQTSAPGGVTLTYNGSEQLTVRSGTSNGSYTYAGTTQDELISQVVPGGATLSYTWGRTDRNALPVLESLTTPHGTSYFVHDESGSPLMMKTYTGSSAYYALDGLGSPVALVNASGVHLSTYSYDPWGAVTESNFTNNAATGLNPFRFAGGLNDRSTGFLKYGQRWYDPGTGRFTQQDALERLADPGNANRYEYAAGNPVNYVDPTGLYCTLSPDRWGAANFRSACKSHDQCYAAKRATRAGCDLAFYWNLLNTCNSAYRSWWEAPKRWACQGVAYGYYRAVRNYGWIFW